MEATSQIVWTTNPQGRVEEDSQTWRAFTGQSFEEMRGEGGFNAIHPEDRPAVMEQWRRAVADRAAVTMEFRLRHVSGDWRSTVVRAVPLVSDGQLQGWVGMHSDISEQKEAQRAQRHLAAIVTSSIDAIISKTMDGTVTSWNAAAERLFGYSAGEMIGQSILRLFPADRVNEEQAILDRLRRGERVENFETLRVAKDGRPIEISLTVSPMYDAAGTLIGASKIVRDITDRRRSEHALRESNEGLRRAETRLRESREQLSLIANMVPALISYIDDAYHYRLANQTYDRWFGISSRQMEGKAVHEVLGDAAWQRVRPYMERALAGEEVSFEQELPYHRGGSRWVRATYTPDRDEETGRVRGFAVMVHDIAEAKRYEEELERLNQSLEQRVAERTSEAEQRAWQLRTLAAELTSAEHRERRRIAQLLHDSVQQMLVAAKMRLGMVQTRVQPGSVAEQQVQMACDLIDKAVQESRTLTGELSPPVLYDAGLAAAIKWLGRRMDEQHGLAVQVDVREVEPASQDIALLLFQAVRELLFNVAKHAKVEEAKVLLHRVDGQARVVVEDSGVGFAVDHMSRIAGDTGFGLLNIRERLEFIGGRMEIESAPGRGTRVILLAPALVDSAAVSETEAELLAEFPEIVQPARAIRVMVVDDHAIVRQGLIGILRGCSDMEVVGEAADGKSAVDAARRLRPDVVIMDVNMPVMNGIEATNQITHSVPGVSVIGVSMHTEEDMAASMRRAGAVAYVRKDSPSEVLLGSIRRAMICDADAGAARSGSSAN